MTRITRIKSHFFANPPTEVLILSGQQLQRRLQRMCTDILILNNIIFDVCYAFYVGLLFLKCMPT